MSEVDKLLELKRAKNELLEALKKDLNEKHNYEMAIRKYMEYRNIYIKIANKEPINDFDSLVKIKESIRKDYEEKGK